jgi:hypothetical protein
MKWLRVVRVAVMSLWLAVVAMGVAAGEEEHCSLAQQLEEGAVLLEPHQDVPHRPETHHTAEPQRAPGRLTEKQRRQQKREQRQALKEYVVAVMRAQEQACEAQRDELEANEDNDAGGEPEFDPVLGDMQLKMARLAQQEQEDPRLRLNHAHPVPAPAFKEKEKEKKKEKTVEEKGQKVGWGGSLEVPARGMESRGSWSWGWSKGGGGKTSRPRADS